MKKVTKASKPTKKHGDEAQDKKLITKMLKGKKK